MPAMSVFVYPEITLPVSCVNSFLTFCLDPLAISGPQR